MGEKPAGGDGGNEVPTIESLSGQIENLNKGIAKYRDDASKAAKDAEAARAEAKAAREEADKVRKSIEEAKGEEDKEPEVKLSKSDQEKLESWAKAQGFVTKDEMQKQEQKLFNDSLKQVESQAVNEFLEKHPELNNDEEWKKIGEQFALYKQPTSLTGYRQILQKIHKELYGNDDAAARARAQIETRKRLSLGGGNQKAEEMEKQIDDYAEKYPHLSRDQIEARLSEINELAESRAKKRAARKK